MSSKAQIVDWLIAKQKSATGPIEIEVAHQRGGSVDCVTFLVNESNEEMADRLFALAAEDATGHGTGPQNYWLRMRIVGGSTEPIGRKPIIVDPRDADEQKGSEDPDEHGLVHQAMRHEEVNLKTYQKGFEYCMQMLSRQIEGMQAVESERQRNELERMALQRQLNQQIANQRVEEQRMINQGRRDTWLMQQAGNLVPLVLGKALAEKGSTLQSHEGQLLLKLLRKLRGEQVEKLMSIFDDSERALVQDLVSGSIDPRFQGFAIQTLMNSLNEEKVSAIHRLMDRGEQRELFVQLFESRKQSLEFATNEPKVFDKPKGPLDYDALPARAGEGVASEGTANDVELGSELGETVGEEVSTPAKKGTGSS